MKFSLLAAVSLLLQGAATWKGMITTVKSIQERAQAAAATECNESVELIGDLAWLKDHQLTQVGARVRNIMLGYEPAETYEMYRAPPPLNSYACQKDTCCVWWYIVQEMELLFRGPSGRCTHAARAAVRLGFHDAAGWSKHTGNHGGADGSIILAAEEMKREANTGLQEIVEQMKLWHVKWGGHGISMADLIQMGATVATVVCPLGPRIRSFVGRPDSSTACADGLLPAMGQNTDELIELFRAKTIQPYGLAALLGAHTASHQRFVEPSRYGAPQDSTPGVWDTLYFNQTFYGAPPPVFTFKPDYLLSQDPRIQPEWLAFTAPGGQKHWNKDYSREYVRLSLLGVHNINNLTDCSCVLPPVTRHRFGPDGYPSDKWSIPTA